MRAEDAVDQLMGELAMLRRERDEAREACHVATAELGALRAWVEHLADGGWTSGTDEAQDDLAAQAARALIEAAAAGTLASR